MWLTLLSDASEMQTLAFRRRYSGTSIQAQVFRQNERHGNKRKDSVSQERQKTQMATAECWAEILSLWGIYFRVGNFRVSFGSGDR